MQQRGSLGKPRAFPNGFGVIGNVGLSSLVLLAAYHAMLKIFVWQIELVG